MNELTKAEEQIMQILWEKEKAFVKDNYPHLTIHFVIQNKREGLGHAIYLTRDIIPPKLNLILVWRVFQLHAKYYNPHLFLLLQSRGDHPLF